MLDEAKFGLFSSIFHQMSHVAAPLHISKLSLNLMFLKIPAALVFPTFCNLKQLTIQVVCEVGYEILGISQIKVCPLLREFNIEITFRSPDDEEDIDEAYKLSKVDLSSSSDDDVHVERTRFDWEYFQSVLGIPIEETNHPNLQLLRVVGFVGCDPDVDLLLFLVLVAFNLETLICDSTSLYKRPQQELIQASRIRQLNLANLSRLRLL